MGRLVHFRLKANNVRNDQSVAIIGDDSPLGDWSVKRPAILEYDEVSSTYKISIEFDKNQTYYYRYLIGCSYKHNSKQQFCVLHYEDDWSDKNVPNRSIVMMDESPSEQTLDDTYVQSKNNGFMNSNETTLVLKVHRDQQSPLKLFDQPSVKSFNIKLNTKMGVIMPSVKYSKLGSYEFQTGEEFEVHESENYYLLYSARVSNLEDLQIDIVVSGGKGAKSFNVYGRMDSNSICETSGIIKTELQSHGAAADSTCAGNIKLEYLIIKPIRLQTDDPEDVFWPKFNSRPYISMFENKAQLDVGHRGCGNSFTTRNSKKELDPPLNSNIRENSINSFQTAFKTGKADMVEFDVSLTRDMTPIVYHDLGLLYKGQLSTVNKHTLTQLQVSDDVDHKSRKDNKFPLNFKPSTDAKNAPFPTLFDVLFDVTDKLGYNVEVKWPQNNINGEIESDLDSFYEINRYCDEIISMANRNGGKRFMYYSSFSADVCLCLALKQSLYPVFQLTNGDTGFYTDYRDTRVRKMETASSFATLYNFTGIVTLVNELLENQETVDKVKSCDLLLGCYGDLLAVDGIRNLVKSTATNAIIYDNIHVHNKKK